jgi:cell wall-associated protease
MIKKFFIALALMLTVNMLSAQYSFRDYQALVALKDTVLKSPQDWFNLDPQLDNFRGISTERAYKELLPGKKSKTIIVAIIDSGIDINHEDLKDKIWVNPGEIPGNGIDDDKNGYVDDINGWNFIGNAKGEMINYDNLEMTRLYAKLKKIYDGKSATDFKGKQLNEFNLYESVKADFEKEHSEAEQNANLYTNILTAYKAADLAIKKELKKEEYTIDEVKAIKTEDKDLNQSIQMLLYFDMMKIKPEDIEEGAKYFKNRLDYNLNVDFEPRALVGDDYSNNSQKYYGNSSVMGPDAEHGTHVAGIIGANRDNGIGIKGIASDIKIMVIRTIPNGDERDKDVANAIYYAADNGANVINMSFGKDYSPLKEIVDKAVQYAEKKGVLMIHAAGNDSRDNDVKKNFPNPGYLKPKKNCATWIEVGASSYTGGEKFVASFSNYGQKSVDVFAPGVEIYSSVPGNKYKIEQGTSMAAPMVTGLAALIWSYYPKLTAADVKKIITESTVKYTNEVVGIPGSESSTEFGKLSITGGVVNAYNALKMAETYKK